MPRVPSPVGRVHTPTIPVAPHPNLAPGLPSVRTQDTTCLFLLSCRGTDPRLPTTTTGSDADRGRDERDRKGQVCRWLRIHARVGTYPAHCTKTQSRRMCRLRPCARCISHARSYFRVRPDVASRRLVAPRRCWSLLSRLSMLLSLAGNTDSWPFKARTGGAAIGR